ncbi:OmpA family protein [Mameliella sediminis]|uniref:OmpA family protein n=1 Tax=Mameliella sediminis TaxID=2836866 RepID=UPI001C43EFC5|nr:OmpA family protein [Mameliella sediminis]MBV7392877.1 OmpA family protein [Mameliella sediminis]
MKRFLLATAALGVLTASLAGPAAAQNFDLKQLCNPALGIKCPPATGTLRRVPKAKTAPKVIVQQPKATVQPPKKVVRVPKKTVQVPQVIVTPQRNKPAVQVIIPKNVSPQVKVPNVQIVRPKGKTPTIKLPTQTVRPGAKVPGVQIAVPPKGKQPAIKVAPNGTLVVKPGQVDLGALRDQLAKDLVTGKPGALRVTPRPGVTIRIPEGNIDLGSSQRQADIVALRDVAKVAAAVGLVAGGVKILDRTLTDEDVRRSSEDFARVATQIGARTGTLDFRNVDLGKVLQRGDRVITNSGDRMVVQNNGVMRVLRNDDVLLNRPGTNVQTFQYKDGSTRNLMMYEDGTQVETVRAPDGRVLRRSSIAPDGTEVVLFDDTRPTEQVHVNELPELKGPTVVAYNSDSDVNGALGAETNVEAGRQFSLAQVRDIEAVRKMAPGINIDTIHFASNSAAIRPEEAEELAALGYALLEAIALNPGEVFLIEGHTDARGHEAYNLSLSDRRAESVALALIEYFGVPPENLVLQGYGESDLLVRTDAAEQANRRAAVRRITPLLTDI